MIPSRYEKLGTVRIWPRICGSQNAGAREFELLCEFVVEVLAPDALAASARARRIARLNAEILDHSMENAAVVIAPVREFGNVRAYLFVFSIFDFFFFFFYIYI